jgi:hypothetical protein
MVLIKGALPSDFSNSSHRTGQVLEKAWIIAEKDLEKELNKSD